MFKQLSLITLVGLLILSITAAQAQSAVDPALVETTIQAFDQTRASTSLHIDMQRLIRIEGTAFGGNQQSSASWDVVQTAAGWNLSGSQTSLFSLGDMTNESTIRYIVVDGVTYLNLDDMQFNGAVMQGNPPQGTPADQPAGAMPFDGEIPEGWFTLEADSADQPLPMLGATDNLVQQAFGALLFPISGDSISSISEIAGDTIDGQAMRVLQITLDSQAVIDSEANTLLSAGGGLIREFAGGMPPQMGENTPQSAPPADAQPPEPDTARDAMLDAANIRVVFAVYIGQDDALVHRIYSVIEIAGSGQNENPISSTITTIYDFSAFNAPVEIVAPAVSS